jgi:hypothetical protein
LDYKTLAKCKKKGLFFQKKNFKLSQCPKGIRRINKSLQII